MLVSFLQQNQSQRQNGTCLKLGGGGGGGQGGEMTQTMYAHNKKKRIKIVNKVDLKEKKLGFHTVP
jgi:hypothetical protein